MSVPPIVIAGAGLAGLTLGRCLLSRGVRSFVIEKASPSPRRHDYSIDLYRWAYKPLLVVLGLEETEFRERLSVNQRGPSADGSNARAFFPVDERSQEYFRCHRGRLETLLRQDLDIKWNHAVTRVKPDHRHVTLETENGKPIETTALVAADGPHSAVRKSLVPDVEADVHGFVVFYGTQSITKEQYAKLIDTEMRSGVSMENRRDNVLLRIFINNTTSTHVDLGYTYSRPARLEPGSDPLYKPNRPTTGAKDIPEAFYVELGSLKDLGPAYTEILDPEKVRKDRVLNWLMRSALPNCSQVRSLAEEGVVMVGDAVHAMPIIGGQGGNLAIKDGTELAEWIATNGTKNLGAYVSERYQQWKHGVERGVQNLQDIHREGRPSL